MKAKTGKSILIQHNADCTYCGKTIHAPVYVIRMGRDSLGRNKYIHVNCYKFGGDKDASSKAKV